MRFLSDAHMDYNLLGEIMLAQFERNGDAKENG